MDGTSPAFPYATVAGCSKDGWCWSTPSPQGNTLHWVSGSSAADVWAVGELGATVHWDGHSWTQIPSGVQEELKGVWSAGASDAWAVGTKMTILHWDGVSWSPVSVPAPPTGFDAVMGSWAAVWGSGPSDVWIAGDYAWSNASGAMIHWDGSQWSLFTMPRAFGAVWGAGPDDVWALGKQNGLFHWDGQSWTMVSSGVDSGIAIWGASSSDIWAANGGLSHWDGMAVTVSDLSGESVEGLWGSSADDVWAVGALEGGDPFTDPWEDESLILHWNGLAWEQMSSTGAGFLFGVWGSRSDDVWAVGQAGAIVHWDGRTWSAPEGPPHMVLYSIWGSGPGDIWAFGDDEMGLAALHWNGQTWAKSEILDWTALGVSGASKPVAYAVWGSGRDDIWLATNWLDGLLVPATLFVHWTGHAWSLDSSLDAQVAASIRVGAMCGNGANDIWAVGSSMGGQMGAAVHWDGTRWSPVTSLSPTDLAHPFSSVWSSGPNDVWIGTEAAVLRWDGTSWSHPVSAAPGPLGIPGYVVGGSGASDVWAVPPWGDGSPSDFYSPTAYSHWNGTAWHDLAGPTLYQLGSMIATSPTNAWVQDGSTVAHWDGTAWTPSDTGTYEIGAGVNGPGPSNFYWDGTQVWTIEMAGVVRHP